MGASQSHGDRDDLVEVGETRILRHPTLRHVKTARTGIGLLMVLVVFMAALNSVISITSAPVGLYLFAITIPIFLLEFGFLIRILCGTNGILCRSFSLILNFDKKKRGILYLLFSIPAYLPSLRNNYSIVSGILLNVTAVFYFVKGWEFKTVATYRSEHTIQPAREPQTQEPSGPERSN